MSESTTHVLLVERMAKWVADELLSGNSTDILIDSSSSRHTDRPPTIEGHVPDLYVNERSYGLLIVGEAKSPSDLESPRSERQIQAFLEYCSLYENALFILAVPWHMTISARCLLEMLKRKAGLHTVLSKVLDRLPG